MSQNNVDLIRTVYGALAAGDVGAVVARMDPGIVWNEAENFPYADGSPYRGPDAIVAGVFARLGGEWDGFEVATEEYIDGGDQVVMLGRYRATCKATGRTINAQCVHVWRIAGGKAVGFQQYVDTLQVAQATGAV